jgi:hypothetical protein
MKDLGDYSGFGDPLDQSCRTAFVPGTPLR